MKVNKKIKISIFGASGIGKFHARNFSKLNVKIDSILSSSKDSGIATANDLSSCLGLDIEYFIDSDYLLKQSSPDAVVIATPNKLHYGQIIKVLDKNIPVFCEKPMFWNNNYSYKFFLKKLEFLSNHPNRAIFVNTSSANYIECIRDDLPAKKNIKSFSLNFVTQGDKKYHEIAEDLLPHGLAMIIELFGHHDITSLKQEFSKDTYKCNFLYSGRSIDFRFEEGSHLQKKFFFSVNDKKFNRIQKEGFSNYQIFVDCISDNKIIKIVDPFEVYASRFISFCNEESETKVDGFLDAAHNLSLMAKILLK